MKVGYRTIKTAAGTPIAITIAQLFGVSNFVSAGILTILCIQPSRKRSYLSAWHRLLACLLAIVFSFVFFEIFGYNPVSVGLMLLTFIPTTVYFKVTPGIATSSVIILNLYASGAITAAFVLDQLLLIATGIGTALLMNLYMPSLDNELNVKQKQLEKNFQVILYEIALYVRNKDIEWDGREITETERILDSAGDLVERDRENHLLRSEHPYREYFRMRARQFELLQRMMPLVTKLPNQVVTSEKIASFFEKLAENVTPANRASVFLEELEELKQEFAAEDLPVTREEFEIRANLFRLLHEIEDYLLLKKKYKKSDVKKGQKIARR
ncbi:aromatic acid exporter family protein [Virgibacillus xinjiangensis]|uniref:Aromatic acid exporter family protein n=1 Tax=Virgibacillus xinjiangensis TaxID=393090 RepID=A0ABV7CRG2_9BACI